MSCDECWLLLTGVADRCWLLLTGADINCRNPLNGNTALISSVDVPKNVDMIRFLVSHGANLDEINSKVGQCTVVWNKQV